jgi:hypothetical protein
MPVAQGEEGHPSERFPAHKEVLMHTYNGGRHAANGPEVDLTHAYEDFE